MKILTNTTVLLLFLLLPVLNANSQSYITPQVLQFRPTGKLGYFFGPHIGYGLRKSGEFRRSWRRNIGIQFVSLKSRAAEMPISGTGYSPQGVMVSLGTVKYSKYNVTLLDLSYDYAVIDKYKYWIYGGGGLVFGGINMKFKEDRPYIGGIEFNGSEALIGMILRVGAEYAITRNIHAYLEGERRYYGLTDGYGYSTNSISFALSVYID